MKVLRMTKKILTKKNETGLNPRNKIAYKDIIIKKIC